MKDARHLSWANLGKLIEGDAPVRIPIAGNPPLQLLIDPGSPSMSLLVPWSHDGPSPVSPLEEIQVAVRTIDGQPYLSFGTSHQRLLQDVFVLLLDIADEIQLRQQPPIQALQQSLASWRDLLREVPILSTEEQIGLLGELWTARRLIQTKGLRSLDGWIGPLRESHDFRLDKVDVEVKTTSRRERVHVIGDLNQLVPSPVHALFLLSLQVQPAGAGSGASVVQAIDGLRECIGGDGVRLAQFDSHLSLAGYHEKHRGHYTKRFALRSSAALVPVDSSFPAITPEVIVQAVGSDAATRLGRVMYEVNVDGLGFGDGTQEFLDVIAASPDGELF